MEADNNDAPADRVGVHAWVAVERACAYRDAPEVAGTHIDVPCDAVVVAVVVAVV